MVMELVFEIPVDLKEVRSVIKPLVTQNDSVVFILTVTENGKDFDLTDASTVSLTHTRRDGTVVVTMGTRFENKATFVLSPNETSIPGGVIAKAQFYDASGRISSLSFGYQVGADPIAGEYIPPEEQLTLIDAIMNAAVVSKADLSYVNSELTVKANKADLVIINQQLAETLKQGEVSVNDINKNLGKFDQTYMTAEFLQQIAGTTPVNAVPAPDSITVSQLTFTPVVGTPSTNLFNKETVTLGKSVSGGDGTLLDNAPYSASDFIKIQANTEYVLETPIVGAFYDANQIFVSAYGGGNPFTTPVNAAWFRTTTVTANLDTQQLSLGAVLPEYENPITKVPFESLGDTVLTTVTDRVLSVSDSLYYKNYFKSVVDHLNNPFIKTQIKLIGDSITAGVGGTGYNTAGDTVEGKHVTNVLTATSWSNMLYHFVDAKYNKAHYVSMNNPHIKWTAANSYQPATDGTTYLNTFTLFNNSATDKGLDFDIYSDQFGIVYTSSPATGILDIYVDGVKVDMLDTYSPTQVYRNEKLITGLTKGNHHIKLVETNTKNAASSAKTIYLEALKIFKTAFVLNYGSSGAPSRFSTSYYDVGDDFVFIQFGTNDRQTYLSTTSTENNLLEHAKYVYDNLDAKIIFMSANPVAVANDTDVIRHFRMEDVDIVVNKVASSLGLPYISNYDAFLRYAKETGVTVDSLSDDGLHPNDLGYKVMFESICREIGLPIIRDGINI